MITVNRAMLLYALLELWQRARFIISRTVFICIEQVAQDFLEGPKNQFYIRMNEI